MENFLILFQKLCQARIRISVLVIGMLAFAVLVFHILTLPSASFSSFTVSTTKIISSVQRENEDSSTTMIVKGVVDMEFSANEEEKNLQVKIKEMRENDGNDLDLRDGFNFDENWGSNNRSLGVRNDLFINFTDQTILPNVQGSNNASSEWKINEKGNGGSISPLPRERHDTTPAGFTDISIGSSKSNLFSPSDAQIPINFPRSSNYEQQPGKNLISHSVTIVANISSPNGQVVEILPKIDKPLLSQSNLTTSNVNPNVNPSNAVLHHMPRKKRRRKSISEMNAILARTRASYRAMRPLWPSSGDKQILSVKSQIEESYVLKSNEELYVPVFRNVSMFTRSYELMEQILKVYIYKEGEKPIFHQPTLKGIYGSEGWFMKLMEENIYFRVSDPTKAHLFYIPFGARLLRNTLHVNGHDRTYLRDFLDKYVDTIAAKYPFWNRTGGADHFLVACHDWAPFITRKSLYHSIRALCNADLSSDFRLGIDISLPETYVRNSSDPLRGLGGKPAKKRKTLAFYAGSVHGYVRSILLEHWENKDPDMKILGPGPPSKTNYVQNMKNSKFCICPRGYEVHSARVVEAIFYECVPVIISDNYVPPLFEVLNWAAFSISISEADIPRLKEILISIPEKKYLSLQMGVKKVQKHFLWHFKPVKYDLFHMILHSVWYNRLYTIRPT